MTEKWIQLSVCSYCHRRQYERYVTGLLDGTRLRYPCPDCGSKRPDGRVTCRYHPIGVIFYRPHDDQWCWGWSIGRVIPCGTKQAALEYSRTAPISDCT